ncbi:hypothetical protein BCV70DRAFT_164572 [Testicularia cyperi]|uniref:Phytase-like domain-containing protein n=1 Tax=Testicularia cyperi TaxID=1882483 RepID=A0A317XK67_9BASI|nr:hypothetical protein BCV70DRAFT_164572 [Testicularia cyperi]
MFSKLLLALPLLGALSASGAAVSSKAGIDPTQFKYEGLVAIGQYAASNRDSNNETLGGFGSAAALVPGHFERRGNKYRGSLYAQPDRGYNVEKTIDYVARHHTFDFEFTEYTGTKNLSFEKAVKLFDMEYQSTLFYHEAVAKKRNTTGLDPTKVRTGGLSTKVPTDGPLAAADGTSLNSISFDAEGLAASPDGTFWVSDEYTPGIYKLASDGTVIAYITPPEAVIPRINGRVNFTSQATPDSGRSPNGGFEGLAVSFDGNRLFAALQRALVQDGGEGAPYLRVFEWDISGLSSVSSFRKGPNPGSAAKLVGEYVFKVATSSKGKARNVSDLIYLGAKTLGLLVRDGNGFGDSETDASYKAVDILDLSKATNIAGSQYDTATGAVAPKGKVVDGISLAGYTTLIDYLVDLPKFGMHAQNEPVDPTLIAAKIESLIVLPTLPPKKSTTKFDKDEYYILSISDNDFQTKSGHMRAIGDYAAEYPQDVPTQIFVFKVKLPGVNRKALLSRLGL